MNIVNKLKEVLATGDMASEHSTIEELLRLLGFYRCKFLNRRDAIIRLTAIDAITQKKFLVAVWRMVSLNVTTDAIELFARSVQTADVHGGIFISTEALNTRKITEQLTSKPFFLMGKGELTRRLASSVFLSTAPATEPSLFDKDDSQKPDNASSQS